MERFRKVDDGDGAKRASGRADAAASAEKFVNPGFLAGIIARVDAIGTCTVNRAQFSAKIVAAFIRMALLPVNHRDAFLHISA